MLEKGVTDGKGENENEIMYSEIGTECVSEKSCFSREIDLR